MSLWDDAETDSATLSSATVSTEFPISRFHPIVDLAAGYEVLDFSQGASAKRFTNSPRTVGRYDEDRAIYTTPLFAGGRRIHMGIDLGAAVGTPVHVFAPGRLFCQGMNPSAGDYGPTIITHHVVDGLELWVLHGHLSLKSLDLRTPGTQIAAGEVLGWIGDEEVNGGWPPHVHIQLSREEPRTHDMPGAVSLEEREAARARYPDPRLILGPLY